MADYEDPENTILIELKDGTVAIELLSRYRAPALRPHERTCPRRVNMTTSPFTA